MNTIELAEKAGFWREHTHVWMCSPEDMETFRRLCIEDHLKGVDVEPVAWQHYYKNQGTELSYSPSLTGFPFRGGATEVAPLYTAKQMAAQRHKALDEAAQVCEEMRKSGNASIHKGYDDTHEDGYIDGCNECEWAIRALKEKK